MQASNFSIVSLSYEFIFKFIIFSLQLCFWSFCCCLWGNSDFVPQNSRHWKDLQRPSPAPQMLVPKFNRSLNLGLPKLNEDGSGNLVHAEHAVFRWFAGGFPSSFQSEPSSVEPVEHKRGVKPLVLVNNNLAEDDDEVGGNISRSSGKPVPENEQFTALRK
ncbi:uncharacterized protein LOC102622368 isoform X2 [Citrus sinensis]|uniref:uncharacterized protein LOC102622368 isoform X2 n=1 Tax=Citrus sinensis TaxID=2711 RepID=UPI0022774B09|nr:uncharacterized protein LOC102622368 isoform X2 [Citrus sinensis]